jgi:hypothetical protein
MASTSLKEKTKRNNLTAPFNVDLGGMIPLATVAVTSATANITFSSIPNYYEHLQIRGILRGERSGNSTQIDLRLNGDSSSSYSTHLLYSAGASAEPVAFSSVTLIGPIVYGPAGLQTSGVFGGFIIDILDYANTNKYKTVRGFGGFGSTSTTGTIGIGSGLWQNTSAVSSVIIQPQDGNWSQYSTLSLYGIKRAGA